MCQSMPFVFPTSKLTRLEEARESQQILDAEVVFGTMASRSLTSCGRVDTMSWPQINNDNQGMSLPPLFYRIVEHHTSHKDAYQDILEVEQYLVRGAEC
jgi:hypothetical protein